MQPTFVAPEVDPELGIAHCLTPDALSRALDATPGAIGATAISPTYFGAVADVAGLAEVAHARGIPLVVDEAWGAHLAFHDDLPAHALSLGADLVISSTHKIVGSLTQSAIVHLGHSAVGIHEEIVDRAVTLVESTSPNSLLLGSLDAARRLAVTRGHELLGETLEAMDDIRAAVRGIEGLDVLDSSLAGAPGVHGYDPLRLAIDVRGTGASGYDVASVLRGRSDINLELAGENVMVGVFGMAEPAAEQGERLVAALRDAVGALGDRPDRRREEFAPPPPWGELAMSPREAFLGPQEAVQAEDAVGRIAAESLAAYPPGIPNVLPGERLTAETLDYIRTAIEHGGSLRGASDRALHTVRVVAEGN
jgi:arginine/lysine/ornithine decarboxylase